MILSVRAIRNSSADTRKGGEFKQEFGSQWCPTPITAWSERKILCLGGAAAFESKDPD